MVLESSTTRYEKGSITSVSLISSALSFVALNFYREKFTGNIEKEQRR
jgi:hypothetical protein